MDFSKYVSGSKIDISNDEWDEIKKKYPKDELLPMLNTALTEHQIEFPFTKPTLEEALQDFEDLRTTSFVDLMSEGKWYSRYEYKWELQDKYINQSNIGNKSSDYFHFWERMACNTLNAPSPVRSWNNEKFRRGALKALWSLKLNGVNESTLSTSIAMRKQVASQFRPSAAKCLYETYEARKVLDPCAGWGDRLTAFLATPDTDTYYGVDVNDALHESYKEQWKLFNGDKICIFDNTPAEQIDYRYEGFDFIFTSPPYFCVEKYCESPVQSYKRYKKIDEWNEKFLHKMIRNAWETLISGGILAINISDVYAKHNHNKICDPMNDYIDTFSDSEYQGAIGYRMSKRINSRADAEGVFGEPIWIWKKS